MRNPFGNLQFRRYLSELQRAEVLNLHGKVVQAARGCWGGKTLDGKYCITVWEDAAVGNGRYFSWKPSKNNGGLLAAWNSGELRAGAEVRVIVLRQKGKQVIGGGKRNIDGGLLLQGPWRVVAQHPNGYGERIPQAGMLVEPIDETGLVPVAWQTTAPTV
jgi:hypothetical protein